MIGRFLHKEYFEFMPVFKLWLSTNHLPTISGSDNAIWDRVKLIPFNVRIPDEKIKSRREVDEMLESERPGILNWAIKGCLEWQRTGLISPAEVTKASNKYRDDSDILKPFFEDACFIKSKGMTEKGKLYEAFAKWADESGERKISKKQFGSELINRGFETDRQSSGKRKEVWKGISLKNGGIIIK
jgi:putative DNA primase/helicase